jgi:hypothetical protein
MKTQWCAKSTLRVLLQLVIFVKPKIGTAQRQFGRLVPSPALRKRCARDSGGLTRAQAGVPPRALLVMQNNCMPTQRLSARNLLAVS